MMAISMCVVTVWGMPVLFTVGTTSTAVSRALTWTGFFEHWIVVQVNNAAVAVHSLLSFQSCFAAALMAVPEYEE